METVSVKPHQTLMDLSVQLKGKIDALFDFALVNDLSITGDLTAGSTLFVPDVPVMDRYVFQQLRDDSVIPANGYTSEDNAAIKGGIGYMGIAVDFRVS